VTRVKSAEHAPADAHDLEGIDPHVYARRWKILAVLCTSLIIVIVGNTVLNVALPTLQQPTEDGGLGATNTEVQWLVDAYALVFAGLLFTAAALGDRFGRKGALQAGLVVFALGSVAGAFADSPAMLIATRAVMGLGAAFVMPSTLSMLTNVFPSRERAKAIAIWAGISGAGAAVGPVASGLLLEHYWWGSTFLINVPIILVALVAGYVLLPKSKDAGETPLDPVGALLSIVGLSALVYAIIEGPRHGWVSTESALWFAGSALALIVFVVWELRNPHPMLDLHLFRNPRFSVASGGITLIFFAMFGSFFMLTQYLQGVLEYSPLGAAVRLLPFSFVIMAVAPQTPKLVARFGADRVGAAGMLLVSLGLFGAAFYDVGTSYLQLLLTMSLLAAGMATAMSPMTTQLMSSVPRDRAGMGSATNDTTRELGGALGVAVLGSLVTSHYTSGVGNSLAAFPDDIREIGEGSLGGMRGLFARGALGDAGEQLLGVAKRAFVDGLTISAVVAACVALCAAVAVKRFLPADRNDPTITGRPGATADQVPVAAD
jgi:EmrB/QacA subfamily drug resistance transporter